MSEQFEPVRRGDSIPVFGVSDLPATHSGLSLYRGVIVCWDGDRDGRILDFIDGLDGRDRSSLVAAHEQRGCLHLVWLGAVPEKYRDGAEVEVVTRYMDGTRLREACDYWHVHAPKVVGG